MKKAVLDFIERAFKLKSRSTTVSTELLAGFTTFAAMSYIMAVNPAILRLAGMDKPTIVTVTALAAAFGCFVMALLTNLPIALAPAMGTNTYFAIIVCVGMGLDWRQALAATFYNGIFFLIISVSGLREKIVRGVPRPLQIGLQCGIGLFIAFFGLQSAKIIVRDENTLVTAGQLASPEAAFALAGLALMAVLLCRKFAASIICTIIIMTIVGFAVKGSDGESISQIPNSVFAIPHGISETFLQLDWGFPFRDFSKAMPVIIVLLMLDMFDTIATVIAMGRASGLMDSKGRMPKLGLALTADAIATIGGALLGTSTTGSYVESAAGIKSGGRTGLTAITVGTLFLLALFFSPLVAIIPPEATAPALIMVGIMMMQGMRELDFDDMTETIPAIFSMLMIALSFKIAEGFAFGIVAYVLTLLASGRSREIKVSTWVLFAAMCAFLAAS